MNNTNYSTYDYIDSLKEDKTNMVGHLNSIGVPVSESETFTELVKNIPNLVPKSNLSDLSITPTTEHQTFNHPDSDGYNQVDVKAVTSSIDSNIKPENIKKNISILGVTGTLESGGTSPTEPSNFYKVRSIEERDSLVDVPEGAICLVDDSSISNATADSQFQVVTLPKQVMFDEPFTEFVDVGYSAVDESAKLHIMGSLDSNIFTMDGFGDIGGQPIEIRIEYISEDGGITYNRMRPEEDTIDFGTPICFAMPDMWNDAIGKFLLIENINFTGIFKYTNNTWNYYNIGINSTSKDYLIGTKAYTSKGTIEGKLISEEITSTIEDTKKTYLIINEFVNKVNSTQTACQSTKNMSSLFGGYSGEYLNITKILNTSGVEYFNEMFSYCSNLKELDLSNFDTSSATNFYFMFSYCSNLKELDLSNFDTSFVTRTAAMFSECPLLKSVNLSSFNTSKVTDMSSMFNRCSSLTSLDLSNFDTSNVQYTFSMFSRCLSLTSLDLSNFDTSNVISMYDMFFGCSSLKFLDISKFTFNKTQVYRDMFKGVPDDCEILVKSDVEKQWITSKFANLTNVKVKEAI